jgi:zeta-carotene desaturase
LLTTTVENIVNGHRAIESVRLSSGVTVRPGAVISAVPYFDIPKVFGNGEEVGIHHTDQFVSSPIVTLHLWFDRHFMHENFAALLDSPLHWIFNKSKLYGHGEDGLLYLSIVISGADEMVERSKETLTADARAELSKYYPGAAEARIVHSVIIKEKRATFSPSVGIEKIRPPFATRYTNVFLAGDWTDTKLPATIEGAILSGRKCAALVRDTLKQHHLNGEFR